ncbi:MAG TPA: response regulator [Acetobacteraceae bacterium]|nr:response regulator [Acetobacteraceae bacterium]
MLDKIDLLIIDDSPDDAELYCRMLSAVPDCRYNCTVANDGAEGLAMLERGSFSCVILDYSLPGCDGLAILAAIRHRLKYIPIVMLTGQERADVAAAALAGGANNYIDKANAGGGRLHAAITAAIAQNEAAFRCADPESRPILIIDGNPDHRKNCIRLLARSEYRSLRIVEAASGADGLARMEAETFLAVLLEHGLPGTDGLDVLARIRARDKITPVILLAGNSSVAVAVDALQSGASDYITKATIDAERLGHAIAKSITKALIAAKDAEIQGKTAALRESEERNRLLLESLTEVAIIQLDPDGRVASWSNAAERIKGYAPDNIIGAHYSVFFTPEDRAADLPTLQLDRAREAGSFTAEGWRVRKDGSRIYVHVAISAIRDDAGELRGFAKVMRDFTERAAEQAALREATERVFLATTGGGVGIWDYNVMQDVLVWDASMYRLYGLTPQDGTGTYELWRKHLHPDDLAAAEQALLDAVNDGAQFNTEFRIIWNDGSVHHLRACAQVTHGAHDGDVRVIGLTWDVTEPRRLTAALAQQAERLTEARDEAERASRAKSRFLAGMSHELRTPLNAIIGYARLLRMEGGLTPSQLARVETMLSAGTHLLEMIHCVLDLSEIETERVALHGEVTDLRLVTSACLELVRQLAEEKGLAIGLVIAGRVPLHVMVDTVRLRQVLLNLLGNAVKFTAAGQVTLRVGTTADDRHLCFEVIDTGVGIPGRKRHRLFQEFGRMRSEETNSAEGAGLGLALSGRLATMMGGALTHADNPGGGSVFTLELPLTASSAPAPSPMPQALPGAPEIAMDRPSTGALEVLIADDSDMNLDVAASFVRVAGHRATCVKGGAEAIVAVIRKRFDLILMDVQMPGMDGLEATRRIRAIPDPRGQVPVVAMTAQVFTEQIRECREAGMTGHLAKPFTETALIAILDQAARDASAGRARRSPRKGEAPSPDLPVIDIETFESITRCLNPATVISHLENIVASASAVLVGLRACGDAAAFDGDSLASVHKLGGSIGLLGFIRVADLARRFEHAVRTATPEAAELGRSLSAALTVSIREARDRLAELKARRPGEAA